MRGVKMIRGKKFYVSVDGGGTKTHLCAYNRYSNSRNYFHTGSTNYKSVGERQASENLRRGFDALKSSLEIGQDELYGCVLGLSGLDAEPDRIVLERMAERAGISKVNRYICNDSELAFHAVGQKPGLVIICGTGSIVYGFTADGKQHRAGGWGSGISDLGSGYWIGTQALQQALLYCDGCREYVDIFGDIAAFYGVEDIQDLPKTVTALMGHQIASVARLIAQQAESGNLFACELLDAAAEHLAALGNSVYKELNFELEKQVDVVLAGGLFNSVVMRKNIEEKLNRHYKMTNINISRGEGDPVDGGVFIALERFENIRKEGMDLVAHGK